MPKPNPTSTDGELQRLIARFEKDAAAIAKKLIDEDRAAEAGQLLHLINTFKGRLRYELEQCSQKAAGA